MGRYLSVLFCRNSLHVEVLTNVVLLIGQGRVVAMGGWLPWMSVCCGWVSAMGASLPWAGGCYGQVVAMGGWLPWVGAALYCRNS